jgi:hypothetical protein
MVTNVKPFIGTWYINWISGQPHGIQQNWSLWIGTGSPNGDTPPALDADCNVIVGFALLDENGVCQISSSDPGNQPMPLLFSNGTLRTLGASDHLPVQIFISMAVAEVIGGASYPSLYGSTVGGDPDQVGVWGADANPAAQPTPRRPGHHGGDGSASAS